MKTTKEVIELIKRYEGLRLHQYKCPSGVLTIGYGHTKQPFPATITKEQADNYLLEDISVFENIVNKYNNAYGYNWNENQFSALVSFAFNCGQGNLLKLLDNGVRNNKQIAEHILLYNKSNGKVLTGLSIRRLEEKEIFSREVQEQKIDIYKNPPILAPYKMKIKMSYRLRTEPNLLTSSLSRVSSGEYVTKIVDKENDFIKVECSDGTKWVHKDGLILEWS